MGLEERTDGTLLWHYSLAMPSLPQICSSAHSYPAFWSSSHWSPGSVISLKIQIHSLPQVANFYWQYHRLLWHQWICGKHIMCSPIKWKDTPFSQSLSLCLVGHLSWFHLVCIVWRLSYFLKMRIGCEPTPQCPIRWTRVLLFGMRSPTSS